LTERLDTFHHEKERNLVLFALLTNLAVAATNREPARAVDFVIKPRNLVQRYS